MLYALLKIFAKIYIKIYCRSIVINPKNLLKHQGPLLLAANHPNSFLDALLLCTLFNKPVYSLARGNVFKNNFCTRLLLKLKLLPIYRVSDGVENLQKNYKTFEQCKKIFKQNGIVLIFSEGQCVNEWHLRPLKKGTARLSISSWQEGIALKVLPVAINYSSFKKFGKNVQIFFGEFITKNDIDFTDGLGKNLCAFNFKLKQQLQPFVFEGDANNKAQLHQQFYVSQNFIKKNLLFLPAIAGGLCHVPLYFCVKKIVKKLSADSNHYDSMMVGILCVTYPLYVLLIVLLSFAITRNFYCLLLFLLLPFSAWAYVQLKKQLD